MKLLLSLGSLFLALGLYGQELSLHIPLSDKSLDQGNQIISLDDGYLLLVQNYCHPAPSDTECMGLLRLDKEGNVLWSQQESSGPDSDLFAGARTMVLHNDTIYVAHRVQKPTHREMRFMAFDLQDGSFLYHQDIEIEYTDALSPFGLQERAGKLLLFGRVRLDGVNSVFMLEVNRQFEVLNEQRVAGPGKIIWLDFSFKKNGGAVVATLEQPGQNVPRLKFIHLDDAYNVVHENELFWTPDFGGAVRVRETDDGNFLLMWPKNNFLVMDLNYSWPYTITKVDSLGNPIWENVMVSKHFQSAITIKVTDTGNILGVGESDYYDHEELPPYTRGGRCFMLDGQTGEMLWDRAIMDERNTIFGWFLDGVEVDEGYALSGVIDTWNPDSIPYLNDPEVWFLTLDQNGCWNGNCEYSIVITGDTTSDSRYKPTSTLEPESETPSLQIFPNPARDVVHIQSAPEDLYRARQIRITDSNGKDLVLMELNAPKSSISLSHFPPGAYYVSYIVDNKLMSTQTLIVQ